MHFTRAGIGSGVGILLTLAGGLAAIFTIRNDQRELELKTTESAKEAFRLQANFYAQAIDGRLRRVMRVSQTNAASIAATLKAASRAATQAATQSSAVKLPTYSIEENAIYRVLEANVKEDELVYGSCIAFMPNLLENHNLFAPYVCRGKRGRATECMKGYTRIGDLCWADLGILPNYDYSKPDKWEWFDGIRQDYARNHAMFQHGLWTAPFLDQDDTNEIMVTFTVPVVLEDRSFAGIATTDVLLENLGDHLFGSTQGNVADGLGAPQLSRAGAVPKDVELFIITQTQPSRVAASGWDLRPGRFVFLTAHSETERKERLNLIQHFTIADVAARPGMENLSVLGSEMMSGREGTAEIRNFPGEVSGGRFVAFAPIRSAQWSLALTSSPNDPIAISRAYLATRATQVIRTIFVVVGCMALIIVVLLRKPAIAFRASYHTTPHPPNESLGDL